jgi:hypothetical protein
VRLSFVRPPDIVIFQLISDRYINGLEGGLVERRADGGAFGARAVVATNEDDQGVVELARVAARVACETHGGGTNVSCRTMQPAIESKCRRQLLMMRPGTAGECTGGREPWKSNGNQTGGSRA